MTGIGRQRSDISGSFRPQAVTCHPVGSLFSLTAVAPASARGRVR